MHRNAPRGSKLQSWFPETFTNCKCWKPCNAEREVRPRPARSQRKYACCRVGVLPRTERPFLTSSCVNGLASASAPNLSWTCHSGSAPSPSAAPGAARRDRNCHCEE